MSDRSEPLRLGDQDSDREFSFDTRAGVRSPESFHPAELALLESVVAGEPGRVLVLGETYGVVGIPAATVADRVAMGVWRARTQALCESNRDRNGVDADVQLIADPTDVPGQFDTVAYAPREYAPNTVVVQHVLEALTILDDGGCVHFAVRGDAGGDAQVEEIAEYASITETREEGDVTVYVIEAPPEFEAPTLVTEYHFQSTVDGVTLDLISRPGLFSADRLDPGTRLLMETIEVTSSDRVLDLACGYGPVGAYAAKQGGNVVLTDDSRPATASAEATLAANDVDAPVHTADGIEGVQGESFDLIASNPPTHAGQVIWEEMFASITDILSPGGRVRIVHHESLDFTPVLDDTLANRRLLATGAEHVIVAGRRPP